MSALGVHNFSPNWEPHTAAVIQKACKDKRDRGMLGHLWLSDRGGSVHSSGSSFITDHRLCLWRRQLGPLSAAGLLREQSLCAAGSVWGLGDGVKVSDTEVTQAGGTFRGQTHLAVGPDPVRRGWVLLGAWDSSVGPPHPFCW